MNVNVTASCRPAPHRTRRILRPRSTPASDRCGAVRSAVERCQASGKSVAHLHLRHLNPFPRNLGEVLGNYRTVLIPELNLGQLALLIRARFLVDAVSFSKMKGRPFTISELEERIEEVLS